MKPIYILDASTFAALTRACAALAHNPEKAGEVGRLIEVLLSRATRAKLEMDEGGAPCLN